MLILGLLVATPALADLLHQESFETETGWTITPAFGAGSNSDHDYMGRYTSGTAPGGFSVGLGSLHGDYFIGGEDTNGPGGTLPTDGIYTMELDAVSVSGYTDLTISIDVNGKEHDRYDSRYSGAGNGDYLEVYRNVDSSGDVLIGRFTKYGVLGSNDSLALDNDLDGLGDVILGDWANIKDYSFDVGATGSSMVVKIVTRFESGDEEIAYDNIRVEGTPGAGNETDAHVTAGGVGAQATISSLVDTQGEKQIVLTFSVQDDGTGPDALNTIINEVAFVPGDANTVSDWTDFIAGAELFDGTSTWIGTVNTSNIEFSGTPLTTLIDGAGAQTWELAIWLTTDLPYYADNEILEFKVGPTSFTTDPTGAGFDLADTPVESGDANNVVDIVGTELRFTTNPPAVVSINSDFLARVGFTDANGGIDEDFASENITISVNTGTGVLSSVTGLTLASTDGQSVWTDLQYNTAETGIILQAVSVTYPTPVLSTSFDAVVAAGIVINSYPLCWDGDASGDAMPFAVHISITNWTAGASQNAYLKVYEGGSNPFHYTSGSGWSSSTSWTAKPIVAIDASGNYDGWLVVKSHGLATFKPRVALVSNTSVRLTGDNIIGTLVDLSTTGAIIEDRDGGTAMTPGNILLARDASMNIIGSWVVEDNGYPQDDGGSAIASGGWRLASCDVCNEDVTFESWNPANWPGSGSAEDSHVELNFCAENGAVVEIGGDITPPDIAQITVLSNTAIDVLFNEDVDQSTAETVGNYDVTPGGITPATATRDGADNALVHLTFGAALADNIYTLTVDNVEDLSGNPASGATGLFTIGGPSNDVVISEVMYDDTAGGDQEWVEIYNATGSPIDISGWILQDDNEYPATAEGVMAIPSGTTINAGQYIVLGTDSTLLADIPAAIICAEPFGSVALANGGDEISIYTAITGGTLIHGSLGSVDTSAYPDIAFDNAGNSIEVCLNTLGSSWDDISWYESDTEFATTGRYRHCTPGAAPHVCAADTTPPEVVSATLITLTSVEILFNEDMDSGTASTPGNYVVNPGTIVPTGATLLGDNRTVSLDFASEFAPNTYTVTVTGVQDVTGNPIAGNNTAQFTVIDAPDLFITEIMPNPAFASALDSLGEWFEVYNDEGSPVDISGWILEDNAGVDTIEGTVTIAAGQYFVFCSKPDSLTNGGVPVDYSYDFGTFGDGISLNNTGELLTIKDASGNFITSLDYTGLPFVEGVSAQHTDTGWCAAGAEWPGAINGDWGTPGTATVCAGPSVPDTVTVCAIRVQDNCGIPLRFNDHLYTRGVVTFVDSCRRTAIIEDDGCAVVIYGDAVHTVMNGHVRAPEVGDSVGVDGSLDQYRGLTEFSIYAPIQPVITYLGGPAVVPGPLTGNFTDISQNGDSCAAEPMEARHYTFEDVTFIDGDGVATFVGETNYTIISGNDTSLFRLEDCDTSVVGELIPQGPVDLTGYVGQFDYDACYCRGYQVNVGNVAPFAEMQCVDPEDLTVIRNGAANEVVLRWQPGLGQVCDCYKIYYAASSVAAFPAEFTFVDCVCGTTEYTHATEPTTLIRFYVVVAVPECGP